MIIDQFTLQINARLLANKNHRLCIEKERPSTRLLFTPFLHKGALPKALVSDIISEMNAPKQVLPETSESSQETIRSSQNRKESTTKRKSSRTHRKSTISKTPTWKPKSVENASPPLISEDSFKRRASIITPPRPKLSEAQRRHLLPTLHAENSFASSVQSNPSDTDLKRNSRSIPMSFPDILSSRGAIMNLSKTPGSPIKNVAFRKLSSTSITLVLPIVPNTSNSRPSIATPRISAITQDSNHTSRISVTVRSASPTARLSATAIRMRNQHLINRERTKQQDIMSEKQFKMDRYIRNKKRPMGPVLDIDFHLVSEHRSIPDYRASRRNQLEQVQQYMDKLELRGKYNISKVRMVNALVAVEDIFKPRILSSRGASRGSRSPTSAHDSNLMTPMDLGSLDSTQVE